MIDVMNVPYILIFHDSCKHQMASYRTSLRIRVNDLCQTHGGGRRKQRKKENPKHKRRKDDAALDQEGSP